MTRLDLVLVVGGMLLLHGAVCVDPPPPPTWPDYTFNSAECENKLSQLQDGLEDIILYATNPGGAVFWSTAADHREGGDNINMLAAQAWARANNNALGFTFYTTLEMTEGGQRLNDLDLFHDPNLPGIQAAFYWNCASMYFARQAIGDLNAFARDLRLQTEHVNTDGNFVPTFFNIELVEILNNDRNAEIVFHYNLNNGWDVWCGDEFYNYHCTGCTTTTDTERHTVSASQTYLAYVEENRAYPHYGNNVPSYTIPC